MGDFLLHQNEYDRGLGRVGIMCLLVSLFGLLSALSVWLVCVEAGASTFAPLAQGHPWEWSEENLSREVPVAAALFLSSLFSALAIGLNTLYRGGILAFFASVCNVFPLLALRHGLVPFAASPFMWVALAAGAIFAFYLGDFASWWCRRRFLQEKQAETVRNLRILRDISSP